MANTYKLLLADDHHIVLDGLEFLLSSDPIFEVVCTAENGIEVLELLKQHRVDIVIMDINMPQMDGITCAKQLRNDYPELKIIILTQYSQKTFIQEVAKIVDGCMLKNNTGKQLTTAIHRIMNDEKHFDDFPNDEHTSEVLGKREIEIIQLLAEGLTSDDIAEKLFISIHTVKTHRKNILRKTGQNSTPDLIAYAINNQLI